MEEDTKFQKLQTYIEAVEKAVSIIVEKSSRGDFSPKSEEEVRYLLSHTPDMTSEAGLMLAEFHHEYEKAKFDTKLVQADLWRQINEKRDVLNLTNAKDREAYVLSQSKYQEAVRRENEWKYRCEQMQVVYDRYESLFVSVRKLANLIEKDQQNQYRKLDYGE